MTCEGRARGAKSGTAWYGTCGRQQAAPGQRVQLIAMTVIELRDDSVDHRQAGADEKSASARIESGQRVFAPGVAVVPWALVKPRIGDGRRLGREIANGDNRQMGGDGAVTVERQRQLVGLVDADPLAMQQPEPRRIAFFELRVEQVSSVGPEQRARHKTAGGILGAVLIAGLLRLKPFDEILRAIMEGAHAAGWDVEQVAWIAGRVGQALAELPMTVDQQNLSACHDVSRAFASASCLPFRSVQGPLDSTSVFAINALMYHLIC